MDIEIGKNIAPGKIAKVKSKIGEEVEHGDEATAFAFSFDSAEAHSCHSQNCYPNPTHSRSSE